LKSDPGCINFSQRIVLDGGLCESYTIIAYTVAIACKELSRDR
jgi:hypothetical protein